MGSLPPVFVEFIGSASKFKAVAGEVSAELDKLDAQGAGAGAKMGAIGSGLLAGAAVAAAATAAVGVEALKQASDFQFQITRLQTAAGEVPANLKLVSDGILNIAKDTGTTLAQLTSGAYVIESAGFHGADALNILKAAAQGAKIENADLGEVTNAVTSLMVDYHLKASDAALVTSQLVTAVGHGKTTFQDLAGALPNVAAAAQSANVTLGETASAIAEMTMHGTDASKAGTYLRQVIGQLEAPTAKARAAMRSLGIDANQLGLTLSSGSGHGLSDAITEIENGIQNHLTPAGLVAMDVFKKSQGSVSDYQKLLANIPPTLVTTFGALTEMTGGVKSMQGFLQLGGQNLAQFNETTKAVNQAVPDASGNVKDWAITSRTLSVEFDRAKEYMQVWLVQIGQKLIPLVQDAIDWTVAHKKQFQEFGQAVQAGAKRIGEELMPAMKLLVTIFQDGVKWVQEHQKGLKQFGEVIGVVVVLAIRSFVQSLRLTWDILHAVLIIVGDLWNFFKKVPAEVKAAWDAVVNFFDGIGSGVASAADAVGNWFANLPGNIVSWLAGAGSWLLDTGKNLALGFLTGAWNTFKTIQELPKKLYDWVVANGGLIGIGEKLIFGFLTGITIAAEAVWAWLKALPGNILAFLTDAGTWLVATGSALATGLKNGIVAGAEAVWNWLRALPGEIWGLVAQAGSWLVNTGRDMLCGFVDGMTAGVQALWQFILDLPSSILHAVSQAGQWLWDTGRQMIEGLVNGMKSLAGKVGDTLKNIAGDAISGVGSFLGINSPSLLVAKELGSPISEGLAKGILDNAHYATNAMTAVARQVTQVPVGAPGVQFGGAVGGLAGLGAAAPTVNVNLTVEGHVTTENDLVDMIEQRFLQLGGRRGQTYQSYKR